MGAGGPRFESGHPDQTMIRAQAISPGPMYCQRESYLDDYDVEVTRIAQTIRGGEPWSVFGLAALMWTACRHLVGEHQLSLMNHSYSIFGRQRVGV